MDRRRPVAWVDAFRWPRSLLLAPLRGIAFWIAVAIPAVYGPSLVLYARGDLSVVAVGGLIGTHGLALVVGHRYHPPDRRDGASPTAEPVSGGSAQGGRA